MANRLLSAAFTAAMTLWGGQARADEVPRPMIAVVVHDYTSIPDAMLQRVTSPTARSSSQSRRLPCFTRKPLTAAEVSASASRNSSGPHTCKLVRCVSR